jgi:hypothetical protein
MPDRETMHNEERWSRRNEDELIMGKEQGIEKKALLYPDTDDHELEDQKPIKVTPLSKGKIIPLFIIL